MKGGGREEREGRMGGEERRQRGGGKGKGEV